MRWIVQDNLIAENTRQQLLQLLDARGVARTTVKLVPFFHALAGPAPDVAGPVFVYGSTGLGYVAKQRGWQPGYFDQNLDYELMLNRYGSLALNAGAVCAPLGDIQPGWARFFVRPVEDNKSFAGMVMTQDEFATFRSNVAALSEEQDVTLRLVDRIVAAPLTRIEAEYRFFVIAGRVVTGSCYKVGDQVQSSPRVPEAVQAFAQSCVDHWHPNAAFTIDIAETPEGLRVIELNSANSAGFYACDVGAIIDAVSQLS